MSIDATQLPTDSASLAGTESRSSLPFEEADVIRYARDVVTHSGTSFRLGMKILPKDRRNAMYAVYAYCREIDDIADEDSSQSKKLAALGEWREEIDRLYAGRPTRKTSLALLHPVENYELAKSEFLLLLEGMEMDAKGPIVRPSLETLMAYCRRVAGAVGMLSMPIFGATPGADSDRFAISLANALQVINILRDVREDAMMGRIYLPAEMLDARGITTVDPDSILASPALGNACADLSLVAKENFEVAREALQNLNWRTVRPALLMMGVYQEYLQRLETRGWDEVTEPLKLSSFEKLTIAARWALAPPVVV